MPTRWSTTPGGHRSWAATTSAPRQFGENLTVDGLTEDAVKLGGLPNAKAIDAALEKLIQVAEADRKKAPK